MLDTRPLLVETNFPDISRAELSTLQVNLGYLCNQTCTHCHVNAGPKRTEIMSLATIKLVIEVLVEKGLNTLDLTGGAPEMNPHFRYLVSAASARGVEVIDRCNLTILLEPGYQQLPAFMADQGVNITASLPCYDQKNVTEQRGKGVFEKSIKALQLLNGLGYGRKVELPLNLVYNPVGAFLPPRQEILEAEYRQRLKADFDIDFDKLLTITNMPISRFGGMLLALGQYDDYMNLLKENYRHCNLESLMCRSLISVDWQGFLFDCDFNQMLELPMPASVRQPLIGTDSERPHLRQLLNRDVTGLSIVTGEHCYGCTAGEGSSCAGSLTKKALIKP